MGSTATGATVSLFDNTAVNATAYDYRVQVTDSLAAVATTGLVTVTVGTSAGGGVGGKSGQRRRGR